MRFIAICLFLFANYVPVGYAQEQTDTVVKRRYRIIAPAQAGSGQVLDSVILAGQAREKFVQDSIAMQHIKYPDSTMVGQAARQFVKEHLYSGFQFLDIPFKSKSTLRSGHTRQPRDPWVIMMVIGLLLYT